MGPKKKVKTKQTKTKEQDKREDGTEEGDRGDTAEAQKGAGKPVGHVGRLIDRLKKKGDLQMVLVSAATRERLKCVVGEDITDSNLYKWIPKEDILEDLYSNKALSDFHQIKDLIVEYSEEKVLVMFDFTRKHEENFFVCLDNFTKQLFLSGLVKQQFLETAQKYSQEVDLSSLYSNICLETRDWQELGSHIEVNDLVDFHSLQKIMVTVEPVGDRSRPTSLGQSDGKYAEFPSYQDETFIALRKSQDRASQCLSEFQDKSAQTSYAVPQNCWTQHQARTMSREQSQQILASEEMLHFLQSVEPRMITALEDNNIFDLFEDKIHDKENGNTTEHLTSKNFEMPISQFFKNQETDSGKQITSIIWNPRFSDLIAVSSSEPSEEFIGRQSMLVKTVALWSLSEPFKPKLLLECSDDVTTLEYLSDDDIAGEQADLNRFCLIVGGGGNGQLFLWDLSAKMPQILQNNGNKDVTRDNKLRLSLYSQELASKVCMIRPNVSSMLEESHKIPVLKIIEAKYIKIQSSGGISARKLTRNGKIQMLSIGADGVILCWEHTTGIYENDPWKPFLKIQSICRLSPNVVFTSVSFKEFVSGKFSIEEGKQSYEDKLLFGTENGELMKCYWSSVKEEGKAEQFTLELTGMGRVHSGPIREIEMSPSLPLLLTLGGSEIGIWDHRNENPLLVSPCLGCPTTGKWSLSWPSIIFVCRQDGILDVWDLLQNTSSSIHTCRAAQGAITSLSIVRENLLAVGDENGNVVLLETPKEFIQGHDQQVDMLTSCLNIGKKQIKLGPLKNGSSISMESEQKYKKQNVSYETSYDDYVLLERNILAAIEKKKF